MICQERAALLAELHAARGTHRRGRVGGLWAALCGCVPWQPNEVAPHQLAALVYNMVTGHQEDLSRSLCNLGVDMRHAAQVGATYGLPRLAALVVRPEFTPLARFLKERQVDLADLQTAIDQIVTQVREAVTGQPKEFS